MFTYQHILSTRTRKYKSVEGITQFISQKMKDTCVDLRNKLINDKGMEIICSHDCSKIKRMKLSQNLIGPDTILRFIVGNWDSLIYLHLYNNHVGDKGCQYLSRARLKCLLELKLCHNQISGAGACHLSKSQWKKFKRVNFRENRIDGFGISRLVRVNWKQFDGICLGENNIQSSERNILLLFGNPNFKYIGLYDRKIEYSQRQQYAKLFTNKYGETIIN